MAKYIERESAKARLRMWITDCVLDGDNEAADCFRDCIDLLDSIPAAEVTPVRRGRWIASHDEFCACSTCKYPVYVGWNQTNYCPNCDAKMDKEVADDKKQPEEAPGE